MMAKEWNWVVGSSGRPQKERVALMREVAYETMSMVGDDRSFKGPTGVGRSGKALSLNISAGGMLLLMEGAPPAERVLRVLVPTPVAEAETPTLAEVRWVRKVPFSTDEGLYFVGLKFLC